MSKWTDDYVLVDSFLSQKIVPRVAPAVTLGDRRGRHRQVCLTVSWIIVS
jgi:hypothetical protein